MCFIANLASNNCLKLSVYGREIITYNISFLCIDTNYRNKRLAEYVQELVDEWNNSEYAEKKWLHVDFVHPVKNLYSTDNGAMIWVAGLLMNDK